MNMIKEVKLDLKDKKILFELDKNSRQSNSEIAKRVGLNKNTVNYKINRMTQEGVIKGYYSVIDSSKLGYFSIRIYLKFFNTNQEDEKKMIEWLNNQKIVGVLAKIETIYDLVIMCWVKSIYEFEDFLQEFKKKFRKHFWQEKVHIFSKVLHFKRKYLLSQKKEYNEEPETIGGKETSDFDELDLKILRLLAKNARMPLIDISTKLKTPERTIAFRIKQLEKKKIIQGYRINLELQKIGFEYYKLNFILNDFSKYEELENFCKIHENVIYIDKTLEELDFEIDVEIKDKQELLRLISEIKEKFSVRNVDILEFKEYIKLESIPQ
jgi:DNA-binding Lrp family transcriptional regulator